MAALSDEYMEILKRELATHYVPHLPQQIPSTNSAEQQAQKQLSRALGAFLLTAICDLDAKSAASAVLDDFQDNGIDAVYFDAKSDTLHVVQGKLKAGQEFKQADAQSFCIGARRLFQQDFDSFNTHVKTRQTELENSLATASVIKLWIVYVGPGVSGVAQAALTDFIADESHGESERLDANVGYFGPDDLERELRRRHSYKPVNAEIRLMHASKVSEPRVTWYGIAHVADLVSFHNQHSKALYEKNIRYYLGNGRSEINKQIQDTLVNDPEAFLYLNNGITALCSEITAKEQKQGRRRLKVLGLSIVNGAQTVAATAEALGAKPDTDISKARVMVTLIQAPADGAFGPRVTRARNSQNPVSVSNFASQDPIQERLRQELSALGITYHFRPEASATPTSGSILLEEALRALAWMQPDVRYPVWLKSGKGDVNNPESSAYKQLFSEDMRGAHLANAVFFSRKILDLLKQADRGANGVERLVYRHGLHAFGWSYLKRLRTRVLVPSIVDPSTIPSLISKSFDEQRQNAADAFLGVQVGKGPLAFFKSQADTTPFLVQLMIKSYGLSGHQAISALDSSDAKEVSPRQKLFSFLSQNAPQI